MTEFDQARMHSFQMSDAEVEKLYELVVPSIHSVHHEFGSRTTQALINLIASQLSQRIAEAGEDSFYIVDAVNHWFTVLALNGDRLPLHITFDDELAAEIQKQVRDE